MSLSKAYRNSPEKLREVVEDILDHGQRDAGVDRERGLPEPLARLRRDAVLPVLVSAHELVRLKQLVDVLQR